MSVYKSRITDPDVKEGENGSKLVIEKLIELWLKQPNRSKPLFEEIAKSIIEYESNNIIVQKQGKYTLAYSVINGNNHIIKKSPFPIVVENAVKEYLAS